MYCFKCGKKIEDDSAFCMFCGIDFNVDKSIDNLKDINKLDKDIKEIFNIYFFDCEEVFDDEMIDLVKFRLRTKYYSYVETMGDYVNIHENEIPLLAYYTKETNEGFEGILLTTERFIWRIKYSSGEWELKDIDDIELTTYAVAPSLIFINRNKGIHSGEIVLPKMKNISKFKFRLLLFLNEINDNKHKKDFNELLKLAVYSEKKFKSNVIRWKRWDIEYKSNNIYEEKFVNEHLEFAHKRYKIPENISIYLLSSAEPYCSKGYAICEDGIYYKNDFELGCIKWNMFMKSKITKQDKYSIKVDKTMFPVENEIEKHISIFNSIKDLIGWKLDCI